MIAVFAITVIYIAFTYLVFFRFKLLKLRPSYALVSGFVLLHLIFVPLIGLRFTAPYSVDLRVVQHTIQLTPREYSLLEFLAFHRGKVATRTMIWEHLYDEYDENTSNVVDVYIRYLRNKIDKGFDPPLILTKWGEGYQLKGE